MGKLHRQANEEKAKKIFDGDDDADSNSQAFDNKDPTKNVPKYIIIPEKSTFKTYWDVLAALALLVSLVPIPFTLVMGLEDILQYTRPIELAFDIFFTVDILIHFFTAFYKDITLVANLWGIFLGYLTSFLLFDVASTIPSLATAELATIYWLKCFRFVRFKRFLNEVSLLLKKAT